MHPKAVPIHPTSTQRPHRVPLSSRCPFPKQSRGFFCQAFARCNISSTSSRTHWLRRVKEPPPFQGIPLSPTLPTLYTRTRTKATPSRYLLLVVMLSRASRSLHQTQLRCLQQRPRQGSSTPQPLYLRHLHHGKAQNIHLWKHAPQGKSAPLRNFSFYLPKTKCKLFPNPHSHTKTQRYSRSFSSSFSHTPTRARP